ncbi:hypothetical protein ACWEQ8_41520 [Streptomyces noursei]
MPQRPPLADIEVAGVTVPKGAPFILVLASGDSRRQQVIPEPNPSSPGSHSHWMPV